MRELEFLLGADGARLVDEDHVRRVGGAGEVAGEVFDGAGGVDQGGGDVGAAVGEGLGEGLALGLEAFALSLAAGGVADKGDALGDDTRQAFEAAEQPGAVGELIAQQHVASGQPGGVIDAFEGGAEQREVGLEHHEDAVLHAGGEVLDVVAQAQAQHHGAGVLAWVHLGGEGGGLRERVVTAGEPERPVGVGDRRRPGPLTRGLPVERRRARLPQPLRQGLIDRREGPEVEVQQVRGGGGGCGHPSLIGIRVEPA